MTIDELERMAETENEAAAAHRHCVRVCVAASCISSRSDQLKDALSSALASSPGCVVKGVGCMGLCSAGPMVAIDDDGPTYGRVQPEDAPELAAHIDDEPLARLRIDTDQPFFQRQTRIVLENSGRIDPERIEEYVAREGYSALITILSEMTPTQVIEQIVRSQIRGRGGAGYPTGLKWTTVAKARAEQKYIICNADEGDPGAFMDRSVLESDPHRVLEGMAIAAYAVGASRGYIYVRGEYPLAVKRLKTAIRQAERAGVLGNAIAGTNFGFSCEIRLGAGAFVCGEETALIASIEGNRGQPRPRPPYPAQVGVFGCPTLINNVETLASIAPIMRRGGDWYAAIGTEKSKGTKVFALAGAVTHTGLIEVPMGIRLREIVYDIGGGTADGRPLKAVQTGGPSGGCIPVQLLDEPVDYESLARLGSIMGSGGMIVMDETSNMVEVARFFMEFCMSESCGKCVPCRVGTAHMYELLGRFASRTATAADLALLEELCVMVAETSLCGLGQSAPNPVVSTLRYFREEYLACLTANDEPVGANA